jgi:hypothetical protein
VKTEEAGLHEKHQYSGKISVVQDNNKNSKNKCKLDTQEEFRKADAYTQWKTARIYGK